MSWTQRQLGFMFPFTFTLWQPFQVVSTQQGVTQQTPFCATEHLHCGVLFQSAHPYVQNLVFACLAAADSFLRYAHALVSRIVAKAE
eukprot:3257714-Karenia_brevis.AAC.1